MFYAGDNSLADMLTDIDEDAIVTEDEALESFDDLLDEIHGEATVCGHRFSSARALRELDPIAHRMAFLDYLDSDYETVYDGDGREAGYMRKD